MKGLIYGLMIYLLLIVAGCQKDIPEPETKISVQPISRATVHDVPVAGIDSEATEPFYVKHEVNNGNVRIECIVPGVTFRETNSNNKGKIILYVDGKKKEEISSAAFIVKGLTAGVHKLKLEVIRENDSTVLMKKEFDVTIR